jgi:hypothetical protein
MGGATSVKLPPAADVVFGGVDLFTAAMTGTYPAVVGGSDAAGTMASFTCGAPSALKFDVPDPSQQGVVNAAFGHVIFTRQGAFDLSQGSSSPTGATPFAKNGTSCANICFGPVTFFLNNNNGPQHMQLHGAMDNGPNPVYLDGAVVVPSTPGDTVVDFPQGAHSISFVSCSTDGPSILMWISTPFITQYGLTVDFDSTFHRNGK